jgi:hypothetical protein
MSRLKKLADKEAQTLCEYLDIAKNSLVKATQNNDGNAYVLEAFFNNNNGDETVMSAIKDLQELEAQLADLSSKMKDIYNTISAPLEKIVSTPEDELKDVQKLI